MMNKILFAAAVGAVSASALAGGSLQTIALEDGATLYIFPDGKMGMEDKYGRAVRMDEG